MKMKFNLILGLSVFVLLISAILFNKYLVLKNNVQIAADSAYKHTIKESQNFQKELKIYIKSGKKMDTENLTIYVTKFEENFGSFGLIKNTIGDVDKPLFQEQRSFFEELRSLIFVDYNRLSIEELKKMDMKIGPLINSLQNLKEY
ncbi:hypothetical protein J2W91_004647 [Paenibacillus amylolyticus]|uniref:Uncharacterized protein n=1 Tax=Paenibacillus amylolyticus TaxID=1451 RepID=A0AAP5LPB9_PAEAM|nr:hypothetical protein [Paenibacillus amylolyticus]MDR6726141.1 hypothetical protein [Paenibacillus amylolyticus]